MSLARRRRAQKVLDARKRAVDLAEADLASCARKALDAEGTAQGARRTYEARLEWRSPGECSSHDLAGESGYVRTLDRRAALLAAAAREAKAIEDAARLKVCIAKMEHRKVETWLERLVEALNAEELRLERLQADEVAARLSRKT
jgi:flagellar biosynthesis chaperone FliJ